VLSPESLIRFALTLIRFTTFFVVTPIFSMRNVPAVTIIGLAGAAALVVMPPLDIPGAVQSVGALVALAAHEVAAGLLLGFLVVLAFAAVQFAGQLTDVPIGFGMATVLDPSTGMQMPVFSQFYFLVAALVFFALDGNQWLCSALAQSYEALPFAGFLQMDLTFETVMSLAKDMFAVGLQLALPVIATILLVDIGLGIVVRAVPQINVFVLGFPIKVAVGLAFIMTAMGAMVAVASRIFAYDGLLMAYVRTLLTAGGQ